MALPPNVVNKQPHDSINAKDWNDGFGQLDQAIAALETGKVDRDPTTGDVLLGGRLTTDGPLTVHGELQLGSGAVTPAFLGLQAVPFSFECPLDASAVDVDFEQYPVSWNGNIPVPGFIRITNITNTTLTEPYTLQVHNEYTRKGSVFGIPRIEVITRGVSVSGPGAFQPTHVDAIAFITVFDLGPRARFSPGLRV